MASETVFVYELLSTLIATISNIDCHFCEKHLILLNFDFDLCYMAFNTAFLYELLFTWIATISNTLNMSFQSPFQRKLFAAFVSFISEAFMFPFDMICEVGLVSKFFITLVTFVPDTFMNAFNMGCRVSLFC